LCPTTAGARWGRGRRAGNRSAGGAPESAPCSKPCMTDARPRRAESGFNQPACSSLGHSLSPGRLARLGIRVLVKPSCRPAGACCALLPSLRTESGALHPARCWPLATAAPVRRWRAPLAVRLRGARHACHSTTNQPTNQLSNHLATQLPAYRAPHVHHTTAPPAECRAPCTHNGRLFVHPQWASIYLSSKPCPTPLLTHTLHPPPPSLGSPVRGCAGW
jgi:hypothetical protein